MEPTTEHEARLRRFERLGGVPLGRLDPEEKQATESNVIVGLQPYKKAVFTFVCPMCGKVVRNDQEMPPACTGPSWTDDHPLEPMVLVPS
jgi:hypothetical protein